MSRLVALLFLCVAAFPAAARADNCTAIPDSGIIPPSLGMGRTFAGPVVEVIDGDSLCVAVGPRVGADWVEVRLADFYAPEFTSPAGPAARAALNRIAMGRQAACVAGLGTYDRIAARCRIGGRSIGDLMRSAGVDEGGNGTPSRPRAVDPQGAFRAPKPSALSCPELRARGGARRGEPGYRQEWDGDNDGIACEPFRR
jgi:hypothetical protein